MLKVCVLIDNEKMPIWVVNSLEQIQKSNFAKIELIVRNESYSTKITSALNSKIKNLNKLFYNIYTEIDKKFFSPKFNAFNLFDYRDLELLKNIEVRNVTPISTKYIDRFKDEDIRFIKSRTFDVIVRFGFRILKGDILKCSKYGVWSFHHGDDLSNRGGPPGFWEVFLNQPVTGSVLQILGDSLDGGQILMRSYSSTDKVSVFRNLNNYYWKTSNFLFIVLKDVATNGENAILQRVKKYNSPIDLYSNTIFKIPKNLDFLPLLIVKAFQIFNSKVQNLIFIEQWILKFKLNKSSDVYANKLYEFNSIIPGKDRFWADPFVVFENEKYYVFFEEFLNKSGKAHISCLEINLNGEVGESNEVIVEDYHLSYPFIFKNNSDYYIIPESQANRSVDLYHCQEFPLKWQKVKTLLDNVDLVDSTIINYNGKYWLFANVQSNKGANTVDELSIFYSHSFDSDNWIPHTQNPVISDVRLARPAGKIFIKEGKLYRPSQDCSIRYGYGLNINEITILNESEYEEKFVKKILPLFGENLLGIHTLNACNSFSIVDALVKRPRFF
jgi:hypothetical protein